MIRKRTLIYLDKHNTIINLEIDFENLNYILSAFHGHL